MAKGFETLDASGAQSSQTSLALHTLGWKAFQDLCAQVCEVVLNRTVSIYREAQDGGQDATFTSPSFSNESISFFAGTIQCKFVSDPHRRLRSGDITGERENIKKLVAAGLAHDYYFMTNMGVDAPIAAEIKSELLSLGVIEPQVYGKEWLTLKIRESARLRALVPRIYGLGDLSVILEERRAEQTRALLGHLMPSLKTYVPTAAHRQAIRVLGECGIVLLTGAPATGKSMIAAILATTVLGGEGHKTFQLDGPSELTEFWNPNETGRFYWIDDAFGPSQLRSDYIDHWIAIMNKVKTALNAGNRFVLTSRQHIWKAAKLKLGIRNHQKLADESAVVNVGALSPDERTQIIYNHIKEGNQDASWKAIIKPFLPEISHSAELLPEIARRLGDKSYTAGIRTLPKDLSRFITQPKAFLKETLNELTDSQRAALTVIFLFRSRFPVHTGKDEHVLLVCDKFGVRQGDINEALTQLDGSFILQKPDGAIRVWTFAHPTIADALADILRDRPDLLELYLQGTKAEVLLSEVVCEGAGIVRDAIIVPPESNDILISRILEVPDETGINKSLFAFLNTRTSDKVLREIISKAPEFLHRKPDFYWRIRYNDRLMLFARLHELRILPPDLRSEAAEEIEEALFERTDASLLDNDSALALFAPQRLLQLSIKLYDHLLAEIPEKVQSIVDDADLTIEPSDNFDDLNSYIRRIEEVFSTTDKVTEALAEIENAVSDGVSVVTQKKAEENSSIEWTGEDIAPKVVTVASSGRSIFSDIDQ